MFSKCIHILQKQPQIDTPGSSPALINRAHEYKMVNDNHIDPKTVLWWSTGRLFYCRNTALNTNCSEVKYIL